MYICDKLRDLKVNDFDYEGLKVNNIFDFSNNEGDASTSRKKLQMPCCIIYDCEEVVLLFFFFF